MKYYQYQSAFNSGVLDTRILGLVDVSQYYNGMITGNNVVCLPQGGVKRRPGLKYVADGVSSEARVIPFVFNVDQTYLLVFRENAIDVYRDDVFKATVTTTYAAADIPNIRFAQSADTMILVDENYAPKLFQRDGSDTSWLFNDLAFVQKPLYDFNDASSPTAVDEIQVITFSSVVTGAPIKITLEGIDTDEFSYQNNGSGAVDMQKALLDLPNTGNSGVSVSRTASNEFTVTFSGASADAWTQMTGRVTNVSGGNISVSTTQNGTSRSEDVWSNTRGWPKTITFHEGRLWFGGSTQKPITIWGSRVNDLFNFDPGKLRDDQSLDVTLDVDQFDEIRAIFSNRDLQVFTSGAEFYVNESPITPSNVAFKRQTGYGSSKIQPKVIDGATIYVQRTGKALREFVFSFAEEAYLSQTTSLLSPSVLNQPVDMAVSVGTSSEDANYVYIVNNDGTMAVFNTLRAQEVAGWTTWDTDGLFLNVCRLVDDIYFVIKRNIDGVDKYYVEKLDSDSVMDSSVNYDSPASATLTGLGHLNGKECRVRADGNVLSNATPSGGSITLSRVAENSAEVGLFFTPTVKTMPVEKDVGVGYDLSSNKRIVKCSAFVQDTTALTINGNIVPFRAFGENVLDNTVQPYTGKKDMYLLGWTKEAQVTLTQEVPAPMTILSLTIEMELA